jgi:hypothetical protein
VRQTSAKRTDGPRGRARWSPINFGLMDRHATSPPYGAKESSFVTLITPVDFYQHHSYHSMHTLLGGLLPQAGLQPVPAEGIIAQVDVIRRAQHPQSAGAGKVV